MGRFTTPASSKQTSNHGSGTRQARDVCPKCGARRVDQQIGLETTPDAYVAALVEIFREARRALRDDGVMWLNLGDTFAGGGRGGNPDDSPFRKQATNRGSLVPRSIVPNFANCFNGSIKGFPMIFGDAMAIGISAEGVNVPLKDNGFPYGVFLSLLGIERITIKQRDNDFTQVLNTLACPCYCRITCPVSRMERHATDLEIVLDADYRLSIVISDLDANTETEFGIDRPASAGAREGDDTALSVEEARKPITEIITDGQAIGDPVSFDTSLKRLPDIYFVDQAIALRDGFNLSTSDRGDFEITKATEQEITFALGGSGWDLTAIDVRHLYFSNSFGSLVHYRELYNKAERLANTLRPKQELGIPEMVKRALMEDGWYCRSTIIWSKPNAMPESVTDRPTKAHELLV
ncbi:MAG: hypothetical protein M0Z43_13540 [Acidithiobacillus sp.]|nr:hypothetical protein [Acidithiobacillus sp.]